jgi:hypothetical protein
LGIPEMPRFSKGKADSELRLIFSYRFSIRVGFWMVQMVVESEEPGRGKGSVDLDGRDFVIEGCECEYGFIHQWVRKKLSGADWRSCAIFLPHD